MKKDCAFSRELMRELHQNAYNWYGHENIDFDRFSSKRVLLKTFFVSLTKSIFRYARLTIIPVKEVSLATDTILDHFSGLEELFDILQDDNSKEVLIKIIAFRMLGHYKVKLPANNPHYWETKRYIQNTLKRKETIKAHFMNWQLHRFELGAAGVPINLYFRCNGILRLFFLHQYEYVGKESSIRAKEGDYVIDAGGCWGDSALYFARLVKENGKVYTFEFVPANLQIMKRNLEMNPGLRNIIEIIPSPVWSESNVPVAYSDNGPGSKIIDEREGKCRHETKSLSIDDFVAGHQISRIDFIKMDIEGAELSALQGAKETLIKFKPKLAISVYHRLSDFYMVPNYISSLGLQYRYYLDHFSIHEEETVLFAEHV